MLLSARDRARTAFAAARGLAPAGPEAAAGIAHAHEVADFLRRNVVQGERARDAEEGRERWSECRL